MFLKLKSYNLLNNCQIDCESDNKRKKIRERLKELRLLMSNWRLISIEWNKKWKAVVIVFNNGIISSIYLNDNNSVINVYHDKYLVNKLLSEHMVNIVFRDNYILISYTQSKLTLVSFTQPLNKLSKHKSKFKLTNRNTVISAIDLENGITRRVERNLLVNESGDLLIVWWKTGSNCVAPWSAPGRNLRDLANIFVYNFIKNNFELISLGIISGHIFRISVNKWNGNQLVILQQSSESAFVLNYCVYEVIESSECLQQIYSIRIPLLRSCVRAQFTSALDKVVLLCDDDRISLFNIDGNALYSLHSSVNAFDFVCNRFDAIFCVSDQFGRLSIYDYALNTIAINYEQLFSDRIGRLNQIKFIDDTKLCLYFNEDKYSNIVLITVPVLIDNKTLVNQYLTSGKCDEAIASLQTINWNSYADSAYFCLNTIFNHLIKQPFSAVRESQLETTLATFLTPMVTIDEEITEEYRLEIHYLAKRFFFHLIRYNCLDKAFLLGIDLKSTHLFRLLHRIATNRHNDRIATAAHLKSQQFRQNQCQHSSPQPILTSGDCEQNNNNNNQINNNNNKEIMNEKKSSLPLESSPNIVGLPTITRVERKNTYHQNVDKKTAKDTEQMPITSILKSSSSKTKATVIGAKPVTFRHINPSDAYNKDIVYFEPSFNPMPTNSLYAITNKKKKSLTVDSNSINFRNNSMHNSVVRLESPKKEFTNKPKFERASYSSYSSSRCSSSSNSSTSTYSSTSASLSIPTPTSTDSSLPPELPPKTYLMNKCLTKAPERPPKKPQINSRSNSLDVDQSDQSYGSRDETDSSCVPINPSNMKSSSKIECIHFGVV